MLKKSTLLLFARQQYLSAFKQQAMLLLPGIVAALLIYAAYNGVAIYKQQTQVRNHYQQQVREHWENMPDKHPHRMAHYGYVVFRPKHVLSIFDGGMESYTGNAIFLEAHRQNTANFSEAGFSTGMLRFGEINMAMILQVLVPLVLIFMGFNSIATDRENGTLKILLSQGASWKEIVTGKAAGLLGIALTILLFALVVLLAAYACIPGYAVRADDLLRTAWLMLAYAFYFGIVAAITVFISARSKTAKLALVSLIGIWLLCVVVLPRTTQAMGSFMYPSPSRIAFETDVEKDLIQKGDSHDPNDAHYTHLKDSVLKAYGVTTVEQLPFNYSGFQMKEGERMSADVYNQHLQHLLHTYGRQNQVSRLCGFINPFAALRHVSMAMSGTDFQAYTGFQQQAEAYRYQLAQHMNNLQIQLISNKKPGKHDAPYRISREYWKSFPDFRYQPLSTAAVVNSEKLSLFTLLLWVAALVVIIPVIAKRIKAI